MAPFASCTSQIKLALVAVELRKIMPARGPSPSRSVEGKPATLAIIVISPLTVLYTYGKASLVAPGTLPTPRTTKLPLCGFAAHPVTGGVPIVPVVQPVGIAVAMLIETTFELPLTQPLLVQVAV